MKLTTEQLDRLANVGAAAACASLESALVYIDAEREMYDSEKEVAARRAFVQAVLDNLPESSTDWPLTRNAFASRGITTDEAAADWISITHDTRMVKPVLTFGEPPAGWGGWHNPENLTPEQVGVADGWRLLLVGEKCQQGSKLNLGEKSSVSWGFSNITSYLNKYATYRTKAPLPAPRTPEQVERADFDAWYATASLDDRCKAAIHGWRTLSPCKPTNS